MQNRAYSILEIKSVDEEKRIIRGTATTPTPDRVGDIVEPLGVKFKNPMPLLWQHKSALPVGQVRFDKATEDGIEFEAVLARPKTSQVLVDRVEEAWESVKLGLVKAVSIGFRAIEYSFMDDGGIRFVETEVMELSLVTIPANADATINSIKSVDASLLAASGLVLEGIDRPVPPRGSGTKKKSTSTVLITGKEDKVKTLSEQIAATEATRAAKVGQMESLMQKASTSGTTLEGADSEAYDELEKEVAEIDKHLARLRNLEKTLLSKAKKAGSENALVVAEGGSGGVEVTASGAAASGVRVIGPNSNIPKGTMFTRYVMALATAKGDQAKALKVASQWKDTMPEIYNVIDADIASFLKAAVGTGTTTDATWAAPLVQYNIMASEFIELLRPATIIGRLPGLRKVPFNIQMPSATAGTTVGWVGENAPKPVGNMQFGTVTLRWSKAAGIVVLTEELVRFSNPNAESVVRQDLTDAMAQFLDRQFVDPAVAEVTNVSPASITNGVTAVTASGTTAAAFRADIKSLFASYFAANLSTAGGVWLMTQTQALSLSLMLNALGQPVFPSITAEGGSLYGYPVVASENVPATGNSPVDGSPIIFLKASEIMLADDGQVVIDASNQASIQMDSAPDSPPSASTNMVSLWQMNMVGVRAERWINWKKRRSTAVAYIQNAKYSE